MGNFFVGISVPPGLRQQLTSVRTGRSGLRWVEERNLHLTVVFIGRLESPEAKERVKAALQAVSHVPAACHVHGCGSFGDGGHPTVLWVGVELSESLRSLHSTIQAAVLGAGVQCDVQPYIPHVTLARLQRLQRTPGQTVKDYIACYASFDSPVFTAASFTLFESGTDAEGYVYIPRGAYPLLDHSPAGDGK